MHWVQFSREMIKVIVRDDYIGIDTKDCIVYGNTGTIATIGLDNMIVVDTGDALLVCPKDRAQDVKDVVERLKIKGRIGLL